MVQRRRHVHPHRRGRPRIGRGGQLHRQEVLRHGRGGLPAQDLRARAVPPGDDDVAVPELPRDPPLANNAHTQHQASMDHGFCGLVQPEVQRAAVLRGPVDAAAPGATTAGSRAAIRNSGAWRNREEKERSRNLCGHWLFRRLAIGSFSLRFRSIQEKG